MYSYTNSLLENVGLKKTKARIEIMHMIEESKILYSAQDIYNKLIKNNININLSSVYRTLEKLVEANLVNQIKLNNEKEAFFEFNTNSNHQFLICDECKTVFIVKENPVIDYDDTLKESYGFSVTNHKIEFHGKCSDCKK